MNNEIQTLYDIQYTDPPSNVRLPRANSSNTYKIDLNTRQISAPPFLSVENDHQSVVLYFECDRYFDFMDLSNTVCVIEYLIPGDKTRVPYIYVVPYFDTQSYLSSGKMVFPWVLNRAATQTSGTLEYAIRFFRISEDPSQTLNYDLRTLPATSKILTGLNVDDSSVQIEYDKIAEKWELLAQQLVDNITYWHVLE